MLPWMSCLVIQKRYVSFNSLSQFRPFLGSSPEVQHVFFMVLLLLSLFLFQCKEKYETAQVLLQGLEEDAHTEDDRRLLQKCIL